MTVAPAVFPLREVESFSKPGTADVTPGDRKKLSGLLKHYAGMAHPFSACKRDQLKHGLSEEHANRRCAVIKDLIRGNTKWRGKAKEEAEEIVVEAAELLHVAIIEMGKPVVERLVAEEDTIFSEAAKLVEVASWMLPAAARRKDFKPLDPEKKKGAKDGDFEKKHPRGKGAEGGQFIRKGASNQAVSGAQRKLGMSPTGTYDQSTVARVKQYQRNHGLLVDGIIGAQTAASLLGQGKQKPGAMSTSTRHALKRLGASGRMREGELEERTVHVETREDEPGVRRATVAKIRTALYDLSEPRNPTHTVKLPRGTAITVKPGVPTRTYSSFNRTFVITSADGETSKDVVGTDDAAEVAKEMDTAAGKKIEEAHLMEAAVRVSGYITKKGRHVGAYSQIRKAIAKLSDGGAAHFPDGITVKQGSGGYEVYGGAEGSDIATGLSTDKAALTVAARSANSKHPKSLGGTKRYDGKDVNRIPAENPKLPGTPHPEFVADRAAKARKKAKLPSRKERAENEERAKEKALARELASMTTGQEKQLPNGVVVKRESVETYGLRVTDPEGRGPKKLLAAPDAAVWAVALQKESRESKRRRRRERDESPMPGVIRKPSESDEIRRRQEKAEKFVKNVNRQFEKGNRQRREEHNARIAARDKRTAEQEHWHNANGVLRGLKPGEERTLPNGTKVKLGSGQFSSGSYYVNGKRVGAARGDVADAAAKAEKLASEVKRHSRGGNAREEAAAPAIFPLR